MIGADGVVDERLRATYHPDIDDKVIQTFVETMGP